MPNAADSKIQGTKQLWYRICTQDRFLEAINNHENQKSSIKAKEQAINIKQNINNSQVLKEQNIKEKGKDVNSQIQKQKFSSVKNHI